MRRTGVMHEHRSACALAINYATTVLHSARQLFLESPRTVTFRVHKPRLVGVKDQVIFDQLSRYNVLMKQRPQFAPTVRLIAEIPHDERDLYITRGRGD